MIVSNYVKQRHRVDDTWLAKTAAAIGVRNPPDDFAAVVLDLRDSRIEVRELRMALGAAMDHIFGEQQLTAEEQDQLQEMV